MIYIVEDVLKKLKRGRNVNTILKWKKNDKCRFVLNKLKINKIPQLNLYAVGANRQIVKLAAKLLFQPNDWFDV